MTHCCQRVQTAYAKGIWKREETFQIPVRWTPLRGRPLGILHGISRLLAADRPFLRASGLVGIDGKLNAQSQSLTTILDRVTIAKTVGFSEPRIHQRREARFPPVTLSRPTDWHITYGPGYRISLAPSAECFNLAGAREYANVMSRYAAERKESVVRRLLLPEGARLPNSPARPAGDTMGTFRIPESPDYRDTVTNYISGC